MSTENPTTILALVGKGGVGKTTTTEHLGIGLAKAGKKVLLVDLDPQANLTACLGWQNVDALDHTVDLNHRNVTFVCQFMEFSGRQMLRHIDKTVDTIINKELQIVPL